MSDVRVGLTRFGMKIYVAEDLPFDLAVAAEMTGENLRRGGDLSAENPHRASDESLLRATGASRRI